MSSKDPTPPTEGSKSAAKKAAKLAAAAEKKAAKTGGVVDAPADAAPKAVPAKKAAAPAASLSQVKVGQDSLNADNVHLVGKDVVEELLRVLAASGVTVPEEVKQNVEEKAVEKIAPILNSLKNAAYTRGFSSHISGPVRMNYF